MALMELEISTKKEERDPRFSTKPLAKLVALFRKIHPREKEV